jgi:hypothetical protein
LWRCCTAIAELDRAGAEADQQMDGQPGLFPDAIDLGNRLQTVKALARID